MNAGLSNLKTLKRELLLAADVAKTDSDASVAALGLGVAALFETACGRKFARAQEVDTFSAERSFWIARRYPLETVASVEVRRDYAGGFAAVPGMPANVNELSGKVDFLGHLGAYGEMARLNYTGGYWWDQGETVPDTMPEGATPLPEDLRAAWVMQCRWFWERRSITDRAKAGFAEDTAALGFAGTQDDLLVPVKNVMSAYRRIAQ